MLSLKLLVLQLTILCKRVWGGWNIREVMGEDCIRWAGCNELKIKA